VPLVKAVIEVLDRAAIDPSKGLLPFIPVQFNPTEYTLEKGAQIAEITIPGIDSPILQLAKLQPATHAPPRIRFFWGSLAFKAIVENVRQQFTLFNPLGLPLRATLSVTFREYKTLEDQLSGLNLMSADHTKRHVVKRGETLSSIAAREYDDPGKWRLIADTNAAQLADVRRLPPGLELEIPPADDAVTLTGTAA